MATEIEKVMSLILKDADQKQDDAGRGGMMHDGGASRLREQVLFYKAGLNNTIPKEWEEYSKKSKRISDPEYSEYVRLKNKFE